MFRSSEPARFLLSLLEASSSPLSIIIRQFSTAVEITKVMSVGHPVTPHNAATVEQAVNFGTACYGVDNREIAVIG